MTYGHMHETTKEYLVRRATESNISLFKLNLEPDEGDRAEVPNRLVDVSIVIDGGLDEEFTVGALYAVNIADWIGEQLNGIKSQHSIEDWSVEVYNTVRHDGDSPIYRITDESAA